MKYTIKAYTKAGQLWASITLGHKGHANSWGLCALKNGADYYVIRTTTI